MASMMTQPTGSEDAASDAESDVSVTSTVQSELKEEYPVECILGAGEMEDIEDGRIFRFYLVKWEGYPIERATREPAEALEGLEEIMHKWRETRMKEIRGLQEPFDVAGWIERDEERRNATRARKRKRRLKRIRLGLPPGPPLESSEDEEARETDQFSETDSEPLIRKRGQQVRDAPGDPLADNSRSNDQITLSTGKEIIRNASIDLTSESSSDSDDLRRNARLGPGLLNTSGTSSSDIDRVVDATLKPSSRSTKDHAQPPTKKGLAVKRPTKSASRNHIEPEREPHISQSKAKKTASTANRSNHSPGPAISGGASQHQDTIRSLNLLKKTGAAARYVRPTPRKLEGPAMFAHMHEPPRKRQRRFEGEFKNASHRNRYRRKAAEEPLPNPETLVFVDLHGDRPGNRNRDVSPHRNVGANLGDPKTTDHPASTSGLGKFNPERKSSLPTVDKGHGTGYSDTKEQGSGSAAGRANRQGYPAGKIPLTCFDWRSGGCSFGDRCRFLHEDTPHLAPADGTVPPGYGRHRHLMTCPFWWSGFCMKDEANCAFAHWNTGLIARPPWEKDLPPLRVDPSEKPPWNRPHLDKPRSEEPLTCFYWKNGYCKKRDDDCKFAHYWTGQVAEPRGSYRASHRQSFDQRNRLHNETVQPASSPLESPALLAPETESKVPTTSPEPQSEPASPQDMFYFPLGRPLGQNGQGAYDFDDAVKASLKIRSHTSDEASVAIKVQLLGLDPNSKKLLHSMLGSYPSFQVDRASTPADIGLVCQTFGHGQVFACGDIAPTHATSRQLDAYAAFLRARQYGGLAGHPEFTMIIFPSQQEDWNFIKPPRPPSPLAPLRFHIRTRLRPVPIEEGGQSRLLVQDTLRGNLNQLFQDLVGVDVRHLILWTQASLVEKSAFLMYHPERHAQELEFLTRVLQANEFAVYHVGDAGAWSYFREHTKSGVIIFHPEIYHYGEIPGLVSFLRRSYNLFQIGADPTPADEDLRGKYACTRLFPTSSVTYITDDVFDTYTDMACDIVRTFVKEMESKPPVARHSKLAGRPGLKEWIYKRLETAKPHNVSASRRLCYEMEQLTATGQQDRFDWPDRSDEELLISVPTEEIPRYAKLWGRDQLAASDYMVEWFAGWACTKATEFRRFEVIYPLKNSKWSEKYQHLAIFTPEEWLSDRKARRKT